MKPEPRIQYLDFTRALAIVLILISHFPDYEIPCLGLYSTYLGWLGVGLFLFISGYLIFLHHSSFKSSTEILKFYKNRFARIYPLYAIALLVFFIVYGLLFPLFGYSSGMDFSFGNMVIHFLDLQILLSPAFAKPLLTLYFIGLIGIFYVLYPFLIQFSGSAREFFFISLVPFLFFAALRVFLHIMDDAFFNYYFIFVSGVLFAWISSCGYDKRIGKFLLVIPIILAFLLVSKISTFSYPEFSLRIPAFLEFAVFDMVIISFCLILAGVSGRYCNDFPHGIQERISEIAVSSYAVYLFHRPILTVFDAAALFLGIPQIMEELLMLLVAIPFVFIVSYYIQVSEGKIKQYFRKRG